MNPMARAAMSGSVGEITIGAADIDARAQGAATCGAGGPIRGLRVIAGTGALVYVDDRTGATVRAGGLVGLEPGDDLEPQGGLAVRTILGTSNATPSAALTLRVLW